jgi:type IV secretion system protein VirD4
MGLSKKKNLSPLQIQTLGDAHFAGPEEVAAAALLGNKGIRLGYYKAPEDRSEGWGQVIRYDGDAHLITVAPTRSGKGRDVLIPALLEYSGSCIVIDPKGQLAAVTKAQRERMGQRVIVLNPFNLLPDELGPTAQYNPMVSLDPQADSFGADCDTLADAIVTNDNRGENHWSDSARQLVSGIMMHLAAHEPTDDKHLPMMRKIVTGPTSGLRWFVKTAMKADAEGFIAAKLARFEDVNEESRELLGIISTANTQTGFIGNKAIAESLRGSDFRFRDLKNTPTTVYLVLPAKYIESCGKWFRLVIASALADLWSETRGVVPVLAILDEFAQLGRLQAIENAMGLAAGFGLQLWPVLQDLTQLKEHYHDRWETFLGAAAVRQFFAPREQFTADYISKMCGVKTVVTQGQSVQHAAELLEKDRTGASWGQQSQPLLHPHNVSSLGPQECLILGPQNTVIDAFRKPYRTELEFESLYSADPYHKTDTAAQNPVAGPVNIPAPTDSFAAREAAAMLGLEKTLGHKRALPLRLLTWGSSTNPIVNVARKVEYVVTLPFRLLAALVTSPMLLGLHGKVGWATLAIVSFLPLAVWEIWVKTPWEMYKAALTHQYTNEALQKNQIGGNLVESRNRAFWDTLTFFSNEALAMPGALLHMRLGELRRDFADKVAAKVQQASATLTMTPAGQADEVGDGFKNLFNGLAEQPGPGTHPKQDAGGPLMQKDGNSSAEAKPDANAPARFDYRNDYQKALDAETERIQRAFGMTEEQIKKPRHDRAVQWCVGTVNEAECIKSFEGKTPPQ